MECQFVVGQKVVRVYGELNPRWIPRGETIPEKGPVYTIRHIAPSPWGGGILVWLKEIINPVLTYRENGEEYTLETGFSSRIFCPLTEKKTDISIFTKMLTTKFVETNPQELVGAATDRIDNLLKRLDACRAKINNALYGDT